MLGELKEVAARLGLEVREERLLREVGYRVRSGFCELHGQPTVFLDRNQPPSDRVEVLLEELSRFDLKGIELSEPVRRLLGRDS